MDPETKRRIVEKLKESGQMSSLRLVLQVAPAAPPLEEILHPARFPTRTDFRKALIEQKRGAGEDALRSLTKRLRILDLKIAPAPLSQAVVIEGPIEALEEALSYPEVEDAMLDVTVDRPVVGKGQRLVSWHDYH